MKKKLLGLVCFAVAAIALVGGAKEGSSGLIGGGAAALVFIFLGLKCLGVIKSRSKKADVGPLVWTTAGSDKYHKTSACQHIAKKETLRLTRAQARSKGYTPCRTCYPYGDRD